MSSALICSLWLLAIAILLSFYVMRQQEGFIGDPNAPQCGLNHPPCPFGTACMNGWCVGTNPPALPPTTGLPVLP